MFMLSPGPIGTMCLCR